MVHLLDFWNFSIHSTLCLLCSGYSFNSSPNNHVEQICQYQSDDNKTNISNTPITPISLASTTVVVHCITGGFLSTKANRDNSSLYNLPISSILVLLIYLVCQEGCHLEWFIHYFGGSSSTSFKVSRLISSADSLAITGVTIETFSNSFYRWHIWSNSIVINI
ncbi:hypothetical protein ACTA71_010425 [Dictyostelium dimigraforme]